MKTTQGRKKIEIKKIEQLNNRQVTFSKRRGGLFKKASEICILSGAEVAVIVSSPGGRVFSFGHESVDAVINKYVHGGSPFSSKQPAKTHHPPPMMKHDEFNNKYNEISKGLEAEKKRSVMIEEAKSAGNGGGFWWDRAVDDSMGLEEMEQYMAALEELKRKVDIRADEMMMMKASSTIPFTSMLATDEADHSIGLGLDYGYPEICPD
ncbi:agamous-like MADS-box protein AGL62 [Cornus florida]|uniref:agamous-like MADS-box protein AGL62 n=1 Tax=Cornus florida TaxID=4283 RepID=UPI00289A7BE9|nr:agamous-like MADS-box protein AGL62 [Cornus florida]